MQDVGFAERREAAVTTRLEQFKKMQARLSSPEVEARLAERKAIVEARNKRLAEKEEARRKEEERLAAIRAAEEAKREAEREAQREAERRRLEAERAAEEQRRAEEKARLAASPAARAARALAELSTGRVGRRGSESRKAS
jgi:hypothetical protein